MDNKEQKYKKKLYKLNTDFKMIFANICFILCIVVTVIGGVYKWIKGENIVQYIIAFCMLMFTFIFANFGLEKIIGLLIKAMKKEKKVNIYDLHTTLLYFTGGHGILIWDLIAGSMLGFMILSSIVFFNRINKVTVLMITAVLAIILTAGHIVGKQIQKHRKYEKKLHYCSKKFIDIEEKKLISEADNSIKKGNNTFTKYILINDEYIIGRMSDIYFEPVAIPRREIKMMEFYFEISHQAQGLPIGRLDVSLKNQKMVRLVVGRHNECNETLKMLNNRQILWKKSESRYV